MSDYCIFTLITKWEWERFITLFKPLELKKKHYLCEFAFLYISTIAVAVLVQFVSNWEHTVPYFRDRPTIGGDCQVRRRFDKHGACC